jgi:hypothetical protein
VQKSHLFGSPVFPSCAPGATFHPGLTVRQETFAGCPLGSHSRGPVVRLGLGRSWSPRDPTAGKVGGPHVNKIAGQHET